MKNPKSLQGKPNLTLFNFHKERETAENQENKKKSQTSSSATSFGGKEGSRSVPLHSTPNVWASAASHLLQNVCFSSVYPIVLAETCTFSCILFCVQSTLFFRVVWKKVVYYGYMVELIKTIHYDKD